MATTNKIIFYALLLFSISNAQKQNLQFTHLKSQDGLASNTVFCILQDSKGFLWFGTYNGLNKYDGYNFYLYKSIDEDNNSLSDDKILALSEDIEGNIWIGTFYMGLNKFDPQSNKFTRYMHDENNDSSLSNNEINSLVTDKSGNVWIGTSEGLNLFDPINNNFIRFLNNPDDPGSLCHNDVSTIFEDKHDILWVGTNKGGLSKFNRTKGTFTSFKHDPENPRSIISNNISCIFEDRWGIIWVATSEDGLDKFNRQSNDFSHILTKSDKLGIIYDICEDSEGKFWIGTNSSGLFVYDAQSGVLIHYEKNTNDPKSLSDNTINTIYEDRTGILWIGTWNGGLNKYNRFEKKFISYSHNSDDPYSISSNSIFGICEDSYGNLWIGTDNKGLCKKTKGSNKFLNYLHNPNNPYSISSNSIFSIYEGNSGEVWIATDDGLNRYNKNEDRFIQIKNIPDDPSSICSNQITQIFLSSKGDLWFGSANDGIDKLAKDAFHFVHYKHNPDDSKSLSTGIISAINEDKEGNLWVGTFGGGLNVIDDEKKEFTHYMNDPGNPLSLSHNEVSVIHRDRQGILWIGTNGGGFNKFNSANKTFKQFKEMNGLPSNMICGILEDDNGNLWISTYKGISKFDPNLETFKNYVVEDGLQGLEFNNWAYFRGHDGSLYFGGTNGLNIINPHSQNINLTIPPIIITDFMLNHRSVQIGYDTIANRTILEKSISELNIVELIHSDRDISFEFAALDFRNPNKNQYAYYLKGFDHNWTLTSAKKRYVTYTNLDPGEYTLRVKGSNSDGIWNEAGVSLTVIINPPWWATWWAYIIYGTVIIILTAGLRGYDLKRQRLKHQFELEHEHAVKLEEIDAIKSRFFANISHEFRTPLTLILGPALKIKTETKDEDLTKQAGLIQRNANRLLELINQLMDLSKIEAGKLKLSVSRGNLASFIRGISMSFESVAEKKDIRFRVKVQKAKIETYFDKDKMEKVISNLLSNAFKFTLEGGEITVSLEETENNTVKIVVHDNGIGISKKDLPRMFDRFYQVDSSHTRQHEGTGIGLALTKELVELHKGKISIDSEEGNWTRVTVELPLGKDQFSEDQISEENEQAQEEREIIVSDFVTNRIVDEDFEDGKTDKNIVLIVEDNTDVREYIREALLYEYNVAEALNGEQGYRKAEKIIPDLIVSDVMMPKMDGFEMLKKVKNDPKTSHIPIILLTAKSEQNDKLEGLSLGAEAYLSKPFDIKELKIRIKSLIEQRQKLQLKFSNGEYTIKQEEKKLGKLDEEFINKVMNIINVHISDEEFSIEQFGHEAGMSRSQIHRKLKALTGKSPSLYLRSIRLSKAKQMIQRREATISEISYQVGFSSPAYFSRCFKEEFGYPPSEPSY